VSDSVELPRPELSNLPQLAKIVSEVSPFHRERVASLMTRDPMYLKRLLDLFRFSEDLENTEGLHLMFKIVKGIIMLNDNSIFEIIFREDCIMDIVGALECECFCADRSAFRGLFW
jgi:protein phosphatase-4 regulatory subunit 3